MKKLSVAAAFSLVELTLAIGIAAFCLIAVFGLIPVGVQTNRNATSQTAATNILSSVVSDIRASPPNSIPSAKYGISRSKGVATTVCFNGQGQFATLLDELTECSLSTLCTNLSKGCAASVPSDLCLSESDLACCSQSPRHSANNAQWLGGNGRHLFCSVGTRVVMFNHVNLTPVEAAECRGCGSGGKPGSCSVYPLWRASVAGPPYRGVAPTGLYAQADDRGAAPPAIALGSRRGDRSTMNALGTR